MSYSKNLEYELILKDSFRVIRGCPKCGRKTHFFNTKKFRVNANGNKLDVWLIYQCEECKHTLNLAIYERQKSSSISKEDYRRFLDNDEQFAKMYGMDIRLFQKNKAEVDFDRLDYEFIKLQETVECSDTKEHIVVTIHNPYQLKMRPEKQIAEALGLSRSRVKNLLEEGAIEVRPLCGGWDPSRFSDPPQAENPGSGILFIK